MVAFFIEKGSRNKIKHISHVGCLLNEVWLLALKVFPVNRIYVVQWDKQGQTVSL